ncbi:hypothetical protein FNF27_01098 [Cafeteria roenbergensis]|uniref:Glycoside hydrolase family 5 domain-containing protein n=2 Tax=Cafeteria roenbergensis TaxID=33653 RepID=A0A5A8EN01_CAFRO|nr:hypothetical protein FNF27_01098 [Cafeteria roenbergensis]
MTDAEIGVLAGLGWNFVRLGFHWHLYEVAPGQFNSTYFALVEDLVRRLGEGGMYVLMDMHQDNWSPLYCGGHGIPAFYGMPLDGRDFWRGGAQAYPWPLATPTYDSNALCVESPTNSSGRYCAVSDCSNVSATPLGWASTYATAAVGSAAQRLYNNAGGAQDAFAEFWVRTVQQLASLPFVVGYGVVNEPWLGDIWEDPTLLLPGQSDKRNLQPLYKRIASAVRTVDAATPVWFEPATGGNILDALPAGFTERPDANSVLGYHIYCPSLQSDLPHPGSRNDTKLWEQFELCVAMNGAQFDVRDADADRLQVPGVLTEFGSVNQLPQTEALLQWTADEMDRRLRGWAYWLLHPSTDPAHPNWEAPILGRPFPHSVPGKIDRFNWNETLRTLSLDFQARAWTSEAQTKLRGATEAVDVAAIFAPTSKFGGTPQWSWTPLDALSNPVHNATTGMLTLELSPDVETGTNVSIALSAHA